MTVTRPVAAKLAMSGTYKVTFTCQSQPMTTSVAIPAGAKDWQVYDFIVQDCPFLKDKFTIVKDGNTYDSSIGGQFYIRFFALAGAQTQWNIIDDTLSGGTLPYVFFANKTEAASSNLWFDPAPYFTWRTAETTPTIDVTVQGYQAVIPNTNAAVSYVATTAQVTAFSSNAPYTSLSVTGSGLTTATSVSYGNRECQITGAPGATTFTCSIDNLTPVLAGSWKPMIITDREQTPVTAAAANIAPVITSCATTPTGGFNLPKGGGQGFECIGNYLPQSQAEVSSGSFQFLYDGASVCTPANVYFISGTKIGCLRSAAFTTTGPFSMTLSLNGQTSTGATVPGATANAPTVSTCSKTSTSPVLAKPISVTYSALSSPCNVNIMTARLQFPNGTVQAAINVLNCTTTLAWVMFPGAPQDPNYKIVLTYSGLGDFSSPCNLAVESTVTGISPVSGSLYGGTLVTITGTNFSPNKLENQISFNGYFCPT